MEGSEKQGLNLSEGKSPSRKIPGMEPLRGEERLTATGIGMHRHSQGEQSVLSGAAGMILRG